ncbi:MAG: arginase [Okeania sp. SIO1H6]|nr:arginase [Okeania sp. SIO1H6]
MKTISNLSSQQFAEFEKVFNLFDANSDGSLTRQEIVDALELLGKGISAKDRTTLLNSVNPTGVVTKDIFIEWMANRADLDIKAELRQIFDLIDVDKSGKLSIEEFSTIIRCFNTTASEAEIETLVKKADLDGDGEIDFEEFIATQSQESELKITIAGLRSFKKILIKYAKVAEISSIRLIEVDSELGAGTRGASMGIAALKAAAMQKQAAYMNAENGILSLDSLRVQTENHSIFSLNHQFPSAKYIDTAYKVFKRTADLVAESFQCGLFPLVLGGDHSTAAGTMAGIKQAFPERKLGVVWIDAHADIHSPYTTPSGNIHGMPVAIAMSLDNREKQINDINSKTIELWEMCKALGLPDNPNLHPDNIVYVAVRDTEPAEDYLIETQHILNITTKQLREMGAEIAAQRCLERLADVDLIYVSFDVDSMDSTISMGTGTPVPGGLFVEEAMILNKTLVNDPRVCCWEICEINPLLDILNTMAENSLDIFDLVVDRITNRLEDPLTKNEV